MLGALSNAVSGMNTVVARATQSASDIVKASSTGEKLDEKLVSLAVDKTDYAANAVVIKTAVKMQKDLLDIKV